MIKKMIGIGVAFVLIMGGIYWFYLAKPTSFPSKEELLVELNDVDPYLDASVIQDTLVLDERHVLVPFISDTDDYGLSYWVWNKHKWRVAMISSRGTPMVWKIDPADPSTYHFVWNMHPEDKMTTMDYFLLRDRSFRITSDGAGSQKETYYPKIQLRTTVSLNESYGAMKLPEEWVRVMNAFNDMGKASPSNGFFNAVFPDQMMQFGWIPTYQDGVELFLEHSSNGRRYYTGVPIDLDHIIILNEPDLEAPLNP